jgi:hypothetical protein
MERLLEQGGVDVRQSPSPKGDARPHPRMEAVVERRGVEGYNLRIMNWPVFEAYVKGVWAVAGPLVGVLIGAYIANRNQRMQWIEDNKKEEYREVLAAMNKTIAAYVNAGFAANDLTEWHNANPHIRVSLEEVMESRLFIAGVLKRLDLDKRFFEALDTLVDARDRPGFLKEVDMLCNALREAASEDIGL